MSGYNIRSALPLVTALALLAACTGSGGGDLYKAEKALFEARKLNGELVVATMNREFLEKTLEAYRDLVSEYGSLAADIEGMEEIVVSAQMELSELEFRAGMLEAARDDFLAAADYARTIESARANAVWSAAYISMEMGDYEKSRELFERFTDTFLGPDDAERTFRMNGRYLVTPIRLAEIERRLGSREGSQRWLDRAARIYSGLIESSDDSLLVRETRYNLLTARLQSGDWQDASALAEKMRGIYDNEVDGPSLLFIEAKIESEGMGRPARAMLPLRKIIEDYPGSHQKIPAMMMLASIHMKEGRTGEAKDIYTEIVEEQGAATSEAAEASWQLASIAEAEGNWVDASLLYRSTYTNYPATVQGMESPLKIASHFADLGEETTAANAYERARELYLKLMSEQYNEGVRLMAEEYYIRSLTDEGRWEEAAERLLTLPGKYPDYHRFRKNHLMAASIYESELGDPERAAATLEECIDLYPGSALAEEAARQLERIRSGG